MNTKRGIISEIEQMAINAIVHQPDDKAAAEKHFSETAKKIVETAMQAIDFIEIGDICRRAVTGAPRAPEATDAELHEAATEEPSAPVSAAPRGVTTIPPGADGTPPADEDEQRKAQSEQQREEARQKRKIHWKAYETKVDLCVMGKTQQNGNVYEVRINKRQTDVSDTYAQCKVNGKVVLTCSFIGGAWMLKRILTGGMQSLVEYKAKRNRDRRRRCAKLAAAAKAQAGEVA